MSSLIDEQYQAAGKFRRDLESPLKSVEEEALEQVILAKIAAREGERIISRSRAVGPLGHLKRLRAVARALGILLLILLTATAWASGSDSDSDSDSGDSDACSGLLEEFDALVAEISEVCEETPCDVDGGPGCEDDPPPSEHCPDSDACIFSDDFETADFSQWSSVSP